MEITRINPDFKWERGNGSLYSPAAESPAIHRTMTNLFGEITETVGRDEYYRNQFISKYGNLYEKFEPANNYPLQFRDELALIAWVTNTLDLVSIKNIRPEETSIGEADRRLVATPNPLRYLSPEATVRPTKDIGQGITMTTEARRITYEIRGTVCAATPIKFNNIQHKLLICSWSNILCN